MVTLNRPVGMLVKPRLGAKSNRFASMLVKVKIMVKQIS